MISVIICSANSNDLQLVIQNITFTIGVPFEIISFDNGGGEKGICELYNQGARKAKFDLLCFMHEDVKIITQDWGQKVAELFQSTLKVGVLGVAGGGYKALTPSGWYCVEFQNPDKSFQNILQGYKLDSKDQLHAYHNPHEEKLSEVVCVDGVWFCTTKKIAEEHPFDEDLLKRFHGYDVDFCLQVFGKHKIFVTYDILMKHASEGNFNKNWLDEILKIHRKWNRHLPLTTSDASEEEIYFTEKRAIKNLVEQMRSWKYSFEEIQKMLLGIIASKRMPFRLFLKGYIHLLEQSFGKRSAENS